MAAWSQDAAPRMPAPLPSARDDEAVRRCQSGDAKAFRHIVEAYGDLLFGTALMMTSDRPLAEDLTQDAFVQAWRRIDTFRRGSPLRPWLLRILVNRVTSHRRRRALRFVPMLWAEGNRSHDPGPDAVVELREEHARLRSALDGLSEDYQRLLTLRYFAELSVPEIAHVTGVREGTVKSRLSRAIGRLREQLTDTDRG